MASMIKVKNRCMRDENVDHELGKAVGNEDRVGGVQIAGLYITKKTVNGIGQVDVSAVNDGLQKWDVLMKRLVFNEIFVDTVKDLLIALFTNLHVTADNLLVTVAEVLNWVEADFITNIDSLYVTVAEVLNWVEADFITNIDGLYVAVAEVVNGVEADFITNIDGLYVAVAEVVNGVEADFIANIDGLLVAVAEVVNGVEADFITNIDGLYVAVAEVVNGVKADFIANTIFKEIDTMVADFCNRFYYSSTLEWDIIYILVSAKVMEVNMLGRLLR
ncbi:apolipo A-IV, putative [Babesia ovis]|uniref:Apolipo A-IV, putative n=1 Tax=Babesia ovis TaxID=5869 RepID=A0A9W5TD41_BABOV|nr:apolipo A-IV, putative [Babesia ovis]